MGFREDNWILIYVASFFGLYLRSLEALTSNKWTIAFYTVWSKLPLCVFPVYIGFDLHSFIFEEGSVMEKFGMLRKVLAFSSFYFKNILFYYLRPRIENLFDLWDESFQEEFYAEKNLTYRRINVERNKRLLRMSVTLAVLAAFCYSTPAYFSKKKKFTHPSGIIYPHRSPEFEVVVTFDLLCTLSATSAGVFDSTLVTIMSTVQSKAEFLRDTLSDMINEFHIDDSGRLMARRNDKDSGSAISPGEVLPFTAASLPDDPSTQEGSPDLGGYEETDLSSPRFESNVAGVEAKLRIWILHHQQLIAAFDKIKEVYSSTATFELGYIVIYTSLTALQLVQVRPGPVVLGIALVASCNLMSLFFWCTLGAELEGVDLFSEGFAGAWFLFPKKIKTAFSFIIMRSRKPLKLYGVALYGVNLVTFFEILKLTYQFFAFMVHVTQKVN